MLFLAWPSLCWTGLAGCKCPRARNNHYDLVKAAAPLRTSSYSLTGVSLLITTTHQLFVFHTTRLQTAEILHHLIQSAIEMILMSRVSVVTLLYTMESRAVRPHDHLRPPVCPQIYLIWRNNRYYLIITG